MEAFTPHHTNTYRATLKGRLQANVLRLLMSSRPITFWSHSRESRSYTHVTPEHVNNQNITGPSGVILVLEDTGATALVCLIIISYCPDSSFKIWCSSTEMKRNTFTLDQCTRDTTFAAGGLGAPQGYHKANLFKSTQVDSGLFRGHFPPLSTRFHENHPVQTNEKLTSLSIGDEFYQVLTTQSSIYAF